MNIHRPKFFRIPKQVETYLIRSFGEAGGKLKESVTTHWADPNTGGTNESGFTALPDITGNSGSYVTSTMWISRMAGVDFLVGPFYTFTAKSPELTKSFSIAGGLWSMPIRCIKN